MPTFTALALDTLLESGDARSTARVQNSFAAEVRTRHMDDDNHSMLERRLSCPPSSRNPERVVVFPPVPKQGRGVSLPPTPQLESDVGGTPSNPKMPRRNGSFSTTGFERKDHWTRISPALYAIPKSTPLPDSPSSFSPSPYVINHKRRGPGLVKSYSEVDVSSFSEQPTDGDSSNAGENNLDSLGNGNCDNHHVVGDGVAESAAAAAADDVSPDDEFEDLFESASIRSVEGSANPTTPVAEFYDAWEELSSDSGNQISAKHSENEFRGMRLSLLMEMEKRERAEETLNHMRNQWQLIASKLSDLGVWIPSNLLEEDEQILEAVSQQASVARFVSESIVRGQAKAEIQMETEAQINQKNTEIARLHDKLRYYEAVNHEMSQRNQEIVESTRRVRQRRKRRQKWIWGSIAASAMVAGSAFVVYSCFLHKSSFCDPPPMEPAGNE